MHYRFSVGLVLPFFAKERVKSQPVLNTGLKGAENGLSYFFTAQKIILLYNSFCDMIVSYISQCRILNFQLTRMI